MQLNIRSILKKLDEHPSAVALKKRSKNPLFLRGLLLTSILILFITTVLWSVLSAQLQQNNADQIVNPFLFQSSSTWHAAIFPAQHSFLFKWPLFVIVKLLGFTTFSYIILTVLTVLLTVGIFVYILSRIERRPLVLSTIILSLSSVLLLIPAQPYNGGLLPVNMAMLTTRNLEYVLFIASIYSLVHAKKILSRKSITSFLLLSLLLASDKLFLSVSLLGAGLSLVLYSLRKRWSLVTIASQWFVISLAATITALGTLWLINALHITHIAPDSVAGPYGVAHSSKSILLGIFYGFIGVFTNLGANASNGTLTIRGIPSAVYHNVFSLYGFGLLVNIAIALTFIWIALKELINSLGLRKASSLKPGPYALLSHVLLWSSIAVCMLFVASNHYYVVDARYLALVTFSLFISFSVWTATKKRLHFGFFLPLFLILGISIVSGSMGAIQLHTKQTNALSSNQSRNSAVEKTLQNHHVKYLVGDYWRVVPIKQLSRGRQQVVPLGDCSTTRQVLTATTWQPNLHKTSFAYLLTRHGSLTDFPNCSIEQITSLYGLPNSSALIAGKLGDPDEILLFYDYGIHKPVNHTFTAKQINAAVLPTNLGDLTNTLCEGPTIINIVAHQDDDLLFMNPANMQDIHAGYCVRTIYLTAGDAGHDSPYWLSREQGSEAAYSYMLGSKQVWVQRTVRLPEGQFVSLAQPLKNNKISLIFMHLPDGNVDGNGFAATNYESLASLQSGKINDMTTVDRQSNYTKKQLDDALAALMHTYLPTHIRTQADYEATRYQDHSDHLTAGKFATDARSEFETTQYDNQLQIPITYYIGYPIHGLDVNISGQELTDKLNTFLAYAQFDGSVCHSIAACSINPGYGNYLDRQYQDPIN